MARQTEYDAKKHKLLIDALTVGLTQREACEYAGFCWSTWCLWRKRVASGDRFHPGVVELVEECEQAIARGHAAVLAQLRKHSAKDTKAAVYLATRRDETQERRLRREKIRAEIDFLKARTNALDGISKVLANATDEELAVVSQVIERARARGSVAGGQSGASAPQPVDDSTDEPR
jgi:hypothetical protein